MATTILPFYSILPPEHHLRILTIHPATALTDPITCSIEVADYRDADYSALSYSWGMNATGEATENRVLEINGQEKPVTQNLYEGLRRIRSPDRPLRIWIDAVCINQQDLAERNSQVSQMADIYRHAAEVLVWLGEGSSEAEDQAMYPFIEQIANHQLDFFQDRGLTCVVHCLLELPSGSCACGLGRAEDDEEWLIDEPEGLVRIDQVVPFFRDHFATSSKSHSFAAHKVAAVVAFLTRRYWTRRWIVQELYVAKKIHWYWGPCQSSFPFDKAAIWSQALRAIVAPMLQALEESTSKFGLQRASFDVSTSLPDLDLSTRCLSQLAALLADHEDEIPHVMARLRSFQCRDPRDVLFAMAGICKPVIKPDYQLSFTQTCAYFSSMLLENHNFAFWKLNLQRRLLNFQPRSADDLPSWTLDIRDLALPQQMDSEDEEDMLDEREAVPWLDLDKDSTLKCQAKHFGVFQSVQPDSKSFELAFSRDDSSRSPAVAQFSAVHQGAKIDELKLVKPGDLICTITRVREERLSPTLFVLREVAEVGNTYEIISLLDGRHYKVTSGLGLCNAGEDLRGRKMHSVLKKLLPKTEAVDEIRIR